MTEASSVAACLDIVRDGQARAVVLIDYETDERTRDAACKLVDYVRTATGSEIPLMTEKQLAAAGEGWSDAVRLYVGIVPADQERPIRDAIAELNVDGFVIYPGDNRLTIIGPTPWGTQFGVFEFLERYVGVRWLLPGPDGEDVPAVSTIRAASEIVRDQPAFLSQRFYIRPGNGILFWDWYNDWALHNRMHEKVNPAHNLFQLFPPEKYGKSHPEFYPKGRVPEGRIMWQPSFTNPDTVTEAIETICRYFDSHPDETAYSLAVNDSGGYCEEDPDHPRYPNRLNSVGSQDMSNLYYAWVNQVAEGVLKRHPDKYFGVLAYAQVYDPPTGVKLHPHVVPFITDDRLSWADPNAETDGKALTEKWLKAAPGLGFYEYLYGSPYAVPRIYPHHMAKVYRYARDAGVRSQIAEAYANYGEGPKLWLAAKLLWNPDADVDALLQEWYERAVGPEAAPYLAAYYDHWERFWTERVPETTWFRNWYAMKPHSNYMHLHITSYLQAVTDEDMEKSREWLEQMTARTQTAAQRKRSRMIMKQFEYYEACVFSYPRNLNIRPIAQSTDGLAWLDKYVRSLKLADERLVMVKDFNLDPWLIHGYSPDIFRFDTMWSGFNDRMMQALTAWIAAEGESGAVRKRIRQLLESESSKVRRYVKLLLAAADRREPLNADSSFESEVGESESYRFEPGGEGTIRRTDRVARTGSHSILMKGITRQGSISHTFSPAPGSYGMTAKVFTADNTIKSRGNVYMTVEFLDGEARSLSQVQTDRRLVDDASGSWTTVAWVGDVPEEIEGSRVAGVRIALFASLFFKEEELFVDDWSFFRLD
ncbi:MAG: hypothetical protein K0Q94_449 [Paenibacillus sp.]|nr:hypothetical protein [Paenibacillus sp.]